uniref:Trimeric intracellular cation channel type B n=1 Tax=Angiostrongylus cantonensis TaxID=6313 RepID=A0A0K0DLG3_ANGCA
LQMCDQVRQDLGSSSLPFSRRHPFSCWLSSMLMCFSGRFLACFLLGEPVITPFRKHDDVILASIIWYSVFYAPFDIIYKLFLFKPITHGIAYATKLYPESYVVQELVGIASGAGSGIMKIAEQLVRGSWSPSQHELLRPSFTTKTCILASLVFILERNSVYITAPHDLVYLCVVGFFVYFKLAAILLGVTDPFAPLENLFCALFMGGIGDALHRFVH